jgi:hypothetical protein
LRPNARIHASGQVWAALCGANPQLPSELLEQSTKDFMLMTERVVGPADALLAQQQLPQFTYSVGLLGCANALASAPKMPPHLWWGMFGVAVPQLQRFAIKVCAQPASATSCERNWSTFGWIHSKQRNKLAAARAADLVYVFSNSRLITNSLVSQPAMVQWHAEMRAEEEDE